MSELCNRRWSAVIRNYITVAENACEITSLRIPGHDPQLRLASAPFYTSVNTINDGRYRCSALWIAPRNPSLRFHGANLFATPVARYRWIPASEPPLSTSVPATSSTSPTAATAATAAIAPIARLPPDIGESTWPMIGPALGGSGAGRSGAAVALTSSCRTVIGCGGRSTAESIGSAVCCGVRRTGSKARTLNAAVDRSPQPPTRRSSGTRPHPQPPPPNALTTARSSSRRSCSGNSGSQSTYSAWRLGSCPAHCW